MKATSRGASPAALASAPAALLDSPGPPARSAGLSGEGGSGSLPELPAVTSPEEETVDQKKKLNDHRGDNPNLPNIGTWWTVMVLSVYGSVAYGRTAGTNNQSQLINKIKIQTPL